MLARWGRFSFQLLVKRLALQVSLDGLFRLGLLICWGFLLYSWGTAKRRMGSVTDFNNCIVPCRFPCDPKLLSMSTIGGVASTSESGRPHKSGWKDTRARRLRLERPVDLLFEQEFWARFHIPNGISIHLVDGEAISFEKQPHNVTYFSKE